MNRLGAYRRREAQTIERMLEAYCAAQHGVSQNGAGRRALCADCAQLLAYSQKRLERCPFAEQKPVCSKCPVHCYSKPRRAAVQAVMRWAGPRLIWRHPLLALGHLWDKRRPVLPLPMPKKN